ncbi:MAG: hypothetical protein ACRCTQ_06100 [Brevinemataceae bacterium]
MKEKVICWGVLNILLISLGNIYSTVDDFTRFTHQNISKELKDQLPFLKIQANGVSQSHPLSEDMLELIFQPQEESFGFFSTITGLNIFNTRFTVSWYMFSTLSDIPSSNEDIMFLLNSKEPCVFSVFTYLNGSWKTHAIFPNMLNIPDKFVYAYVSLPNEDGVLVPLAGQSFYYDTISQITKKTRNVSLNTDILEYWSKKGYFI